MEQVKRKRGRPRKETVIEQEPIKYADRYEESLIRQLFSEALININSKQEEDNEESEYFETSRTLAHHKRDGLWDVPIDEPIQYFDPDLSYELTGYRPITMTQGLDFDPTPFTVAADTYIKNNKYTEYPKGCKPYNDYWNEQYDRCVNGYTVNGYRITGDHYFFLNFYRMQTIIEEAVKEVSGRQQGFPKFLAKQYEFFHYVEMCEYLGDDVLMLKARGLGFSEILACLGVRPFITTREFRTVYTAAAEPQVGPVLDKCWTQLNWLNMNTNGGMKRLRQKIDNIKQKRASLVDPEGTEYGRMAEIEGIVADNPRKVRGDRTERLIFEEAGSNPNLVKSWIQGNSLVNLGGRKIGIKIAGGTGGDSGAPLAGLAKMFNNPQAYGILPYKHSYTRDGKVVFTGFFIPAHTFALIPEYLDKRGVTDSIRFRQFYENQRSLLEGNDLLDACAENCFTPDEALLRQGDNIFDSAVISDRLTTLTVHQKDIKGQPTALIWDKSNPNEKEKIKAIPSPSSKLIIYEPPILDEHGKPYSNLYVSGTDAIDMGTKDSATDTDVSDFCIIVKKRVFGLQEPKIVAIYKDRPKDIRTAYEISIKLLTWYNCQTLLEYTKISMRTYFDERKCSKLLMKRPSFAISKKTSKSKDLIGVQATEPVIKHALELISHFINDYCHTIDSVEILEQLLNYSYAEKRKFDIVAALGMTELADEELTGISPKAIENTNNTWRDFGYYIDKNGVKRRGIIPKWRN